MDPSREAVVCQAPAADGRPYRFMRLPNTEGTNVYALTLAPHELPHRFAVATRWALVVAAIVGGLPALVLYAAMWERQASGWAAVELTGMSVACLAAAGLASGFGLGFLLGGGPRQLAARFASGDVIWNGRPVGKLLQIDVDERAGTVAFVTEAGSKSIALRAGADAVALAGAMIDALGVAA